MRCGTSSRTYPNSPFTILSVGSGLVPDIVGEAVSVNKDKGARTQGSHGARSRGSGCRWATGLRITAIGLHRGTCRKERRRSGQDQGRWRKPSPIGRMPDATNRLLAFQSDEILLDGDLRCFIWEAVTMRGGRAGNERLNNSGKDCGHGARLQFKDPVELPRK